MLTDLPVKFINGERMQKVSVHRRLECKVSEKYTKHHL